MSTKKYRIRLTTDEQQELKALVSRGRAVAYKQTHARIPQSWLGAGSADER